MAMPDSLKLIAKEKELKCYDGRLLEHKIGIRKTISTSVENPCVLANYYKNILKEYKRYNVKISEKISTIIGTIIVIPLTIFVGTIGIAILVGISRKPIENNSIVPIEMIHNTAVSNESEDDSIVLSLSDTLLASVGYFSKNFEGSHLAYIYIDNILNTTLQTSEGQGDLSLSDTLLSEGIHEVKIVQHDNDSTNGDILFNKILNFEVKIAKNNSSINSESVWIDSTGKKYHSKSSCSNMDSPYQVSISEAQNKGYDYCKKCY